MFWWASALSAPFSALDMSWPFGSAQSFWNLTASTPENLDFSLAENSGHVITVL